ncbi:DUF3883 domain-containing protein [Limnohabitans sp. JUR4]|uniref:DUF3883 domain-containing protein n=2 Tax=Limnohabitans radicicola TaxID=2771427 RepID=A0A927FHY0_9BURK|nr:DUF3883 domain-containing protein [Limnohabitans radicicola]
MLALELSGQTFNKSAHRKALKQKLSQRSDGSIEFKHGNISAVMIELGFPYIRGYQPRGNYQSLLLEVATEQIKWLPTLDAAAQSAAVQPAQVPDLQDFSHVSVDPPSKTHKAAESSVFKELAPVKRDYLAQEARNQSLGLAGEEFVLQYEHWRLISLGHKNLADKVEHVSKTKGDGLGYDILSFDANGKEKFIEVKTTSFGRDTPFFVTDRELNFSQVAESQFHLTRVFEFRKSPKIFSLRGSIGQHCNLDPVTYRASFT